MCLPAGCSSGFEKVQEENLQLIEAFCIPGAERFFCLVLLTLA